jgi:hypothetical protein
LDSIYVRQSKMPTSNQRQAGIKIR